jgi:non-ribosomal peptide synthetase component F
MIKYLQHHFFEHTADQRPNATCLRHGDQSYTYAEMEDFANRTAHALLQAGVESNDRICILTNKDMHLYASVLGALKSGGCWVPLSRSFPAGRIKRLMTSLRPKAVLVDPAHRDLLDAELAGLTKILVMSEVVENSNYSTKRPSVHIASSDLAYVVFTSGSTGTPKGVMVDHQGTSNFLNHALEYFQIEPESHFGHFSEITFDPSIFDLFVCWGMGGTLVPFDKPSYKVNPLLFFKDNEINVIFCVPNLLEKVVDLGQLEEPALLNLKHVLLTGEVVKRPLVKALYSSLKDVKIYNMYGTTEMLCPVFGSIWSTRMAIRAMLAKASYRARRSLAVIGIINS